MSMQSAASGDSARLPSPPVHDTDARSRFSGWDYAGMLAGFLLALAITVVNSRGRVFWEDEMLGWMLLTDTWRHMVHAWNLGADGGGFSFYILGRGWFAVFGGSRLAFRLFSSACFGLAFVTLWATLRRRYPTGIVAFAAVNTFFFSLPFTQHLLEGRFYGLLVLATALAFWLALKLDDTPDPVPKYLYWLAFAIHGLLTTSHLLGLVYSAFLLAASVILDRMRRRRRIGLYLSMAAAWLLLVPEKTSILAAQRVGKPHFWTRPPKFSDLLGVYSGFSHEILFVLLALTAVSTVVLVRSPAGPAASLRQAYQQRRSVYVTTVCLLLVPCAFLLEGLVSTWLFNERYLQPVTLAIAFLTAELCLLIAQGRGDALGSRTSPVVLTAVRAAFSFVFGLFLLFWVFHHVAQQTPSPPDFTEALTAHMPPGLPVVVEDAFTFTELMNTEAHSGVRYMFLLDWPWAVAPDSPHLEVTQYHLMENWKNAGYFADRIENVDEFLRQNPRFLLIHDAGIHPAPHEQVEIGNPLEERLAHDPNAPAYEFRKVFTFDRTYHDGVRDTVWLACRNGCGADTNPIQGATHCVRYAPGKVCCDNQPCMEALPANVKSAIQ